MIDERDPEVIAFRRLERKQALALSTDQRFQAEHPEWDERQRANAVKAALLQAGFTAKECDPEEYFQSEEWFSAVRGQGKVERANVRRFDGLAHIKGRSE
jgi:hypothetical protein